MKKFLSIIAIILITTVVNAQSVLPRWGGGPPTNDNTGRILTYSFGKTVITSSSTAILYHKPNAFQTFIITDSLRHAITDSSSINNAYAGDQLILRYSSDSLAAGRVVTFGNHMISAGTLTVDKNQKACITFIFDGVAWIETGRAKQ